jgi:hypothetical protein
MLLETCAFTFLAALGVSAATVETSSVPGAAFDRFVIIYFENENYEKAIGDRMFPSPKFSQTPTDARL